MRPSVCTFICRSYGARKFVPMWPIWRAARAVQYAASPFPTSSLILVPRSPPCVCLVQCQLYWLMTLEVVLVTAVARVCVYVVHLRRCAVPFFGEYATRLPKLLTFTFQRLMRGDLADGANFATIRTASNTAVVVVRYRLLCISITSRFRAQPSIIIVYRQREWRARKCSTSSASRNFYFCFSFRLSRFVSASRSPTMLYRYPTRFFFSASPFLHFSPFYPHPLFLAERLDNAAAASGTVVEFTFISPHRLLDPRVSTELC